MIRVRLPRIAWSLLEAASREAGVSVSEVVAGLVLHFLGEDEQEEDPAEEPPVHCRSRVERRQDPRMTAEEEALALARLREEGLWTRMTQEPPFGVRLSRDPRGRLRPAPTVEKLG